MRSADVQQDQELTCRRYGYAITTGNVPPDCPARRGDDALAALGQMQAAAWRATAADRHGRATRLHAIHRCCSDCISEGAGRLFDAVEVALSR